MISLIAFFNTNTVCFVSVFAMVLNFVLVLFTRRVFSDIPRYLQYD